MGRPVIREGTGNPFGSIVCRSGQKVTKTSGDSGQAWSSCDVRCHGVPSGTARVILSIQQNDDISSFCCGIGKSLWVGKILSGSLRYVCYFCVTPAVEVRVSFSMGRGGRFYLAMLRRIGRIANFKVGPDGTRAECGAGRRFHDGARCFSAPFMFLEKAVRLRRPHCTDRTLW